jgi:hypothetical protein
VRIVQYRLFFGSAKAEIREFCEPAEEVWSRAESRSLTESTGFLKEADVDRYFELLSKARAKAGKGTVYDDRMARIRRNAVAQKSSSRTSSAQALRSMA